VSDNRCRIVNERYFRTNDILLSRALPAVAFLTIMPILRVLERTSVTGVKEEGVTEVMVNSC